MPRSLRWILPSVSQPLIQNNFNCGLLRDTIFCTLFEYAGFPERSTFIQEETLQAKLNKRNLITYGMLYETAMKQVALLTVIQEMTGLNLSWDTDSPDLRFIMFFPKFLNLNTLLVPYIRP
jgi:hypothetical protein